MLTITPSPSLPSQNVYQPVNRSPQLQVEVTTFLSLTAQGDDIAFEKLYRLASPMLRRHLQYILKRDSWAEEVLQDVFIKIWMQASSYLPERSPAMSWLKIIARNAAFDRLRQREFEELQMSEELIETLVDFAPGPLQICIDNMDAEKIKHFIDALPERLREPLTLAFYQGLSHGDIANHLGQPLGTVKTRIRRALASIRVAMTVRSQL
jgi:RNA polymerase sigma-70 factor, ECF subfamily